MHWQGPPTVGAGGQPMTTSVQGRNLRSKNPLPEARYGLSKQLLALICLCKVLMCLWELQGSSNSRCRASP